MFGNCPNLSCHLNVSTFIITSSRPRTGWNHHPKPSINTIEDTIVRTRGQPDNSTPTFSDRASHILQSVPNATFPILSIINRTNRFSFAVGIDDETVPQHRAGELYLGSVNSKIHGVSCKSFKILVNYLRYGLQVFLWKYDAEMTVQKAIPFACLGTL